MLNKDSLLDLEFISFMLFYIFILYTNEWFAINTQNMEKNQKPLYDRGHELLTPKISSKIPDYLLTALIIYFLIRWFLTYKPVLTNYFFLISILFIMRIFVFMGTETPTPMQKCHGKSKWKDIKWWFGEDDKTCIDNMFSGHTAHATGIFLFTLLFSTYLSEKIATFFIMIMIMITLIWSRMHYTSDVVVGFLLTVGYFFAAFKVEKILKLS